MSRTIPLVLATLAIPLQAEVTFHRDIAPLVHENCTGCHRPGQSGPFSLITYRDVRKRSKTIEEVLLARYMPPWKPVNTDVRYAHDRRLSQQEIDLVSAWVQAGCPEGDPQEGVTPPSFPSGWYLGEPDLVVTMNGRFEVPAEGRDIYRSFVFPLQLPEDKWVKAVELRPQARSTVHHALFFIDTTGQARRDDGRDGQPGFSGMDFLRGQVRAGEDPSAAAFNGARGLGGHVPGAVPARLPGDLAMFLPKGSDIVMQTHFHPTGKKETEQAELALYFTDQPPAKPLVPIQIPPFFGRTMGIDIPAGESDYVVEDEFNLPVPVEAVVVGGHAHYLCRTMTMTATLPGGTVITLLDIQDWDLDWQDRYQFADPLDLPAGTVLKSRLVYDNSRSNPENPFDPPRRIKWGRESTDEMGSITLTVVPKDKAHTQALATAQRRQLLQQNDRKAPPVRKDSLTVTSYDSNQDGIIQPDEVPESSRQRIFDRFDRNDDDLLDKDEQSALQRYLDTISRLRNSPKR